MQQYGFDLFFITRRTAKRGGTRHCHRGANEDGFTANFAETDYIIFSFIKKYNIL